MIFVLIGIIAFLVAGFVSYGTTHWIERSAARNGWVDEPASTRKIHREPTPTAGGLGIAAGLTAGVGVLLVALNVDGLFFTLPAGVFWLGALVMVVTGFVDDTRTVSFKKKFFIQSAVAYGLLYFGYGIDVEALLPIGLSTYHATLLTVPVTMGWVVGVMNAVNFIDGLDGLAGGVVLIVLATFGAAFGLQGEWGLTLTALVIIGALLGFLRHNFHPASIFMGDSGSLLLGYLAAVFPLLAPMNEQPVINVLIPIAALGLPILDTSTSIVRRTMNHQSIFHADKDHIHHRLLRRFPESEAVRWMYAAAAWFGLTAVLIAIVSPFWSYVLCGTTALVSVAWVVRLGYFDAHMPIRKRTSALPRHSSLQSTSASDAQQEMEEGLMVEPEGTGRSIEGAVQ